MKSRLRQLGKDSVIYGFGGMFARGIGFFLLPVYTRIFTPGEYGTIEMLVVLNSLLGTVLVMGMDSAQTFYFFEQKEKGKEAQAGVVTAVLLWRLTWGAAIVAVTMLVSPLINASFFRGNLSWEYFAVAFVGGLFAQLTMQSADVFRLLYRPWSYICITLTHTVGSAAIAIVLVVWLHIGILGYFIGFALGSLFAALAGWWGVRRYLDWSSLHKSWWPKLVRFGAPLVPAGMAMYVLNTADRWFISHYHGQEALGIYAIGAKFAMMIALAVAAFRKSWWPIAMDAIQSADGPELFRTVARLYLGLGAAGVVVLTALSPLMLRWLTAPPYHSAYPILGVLAWHSIFYGFYMVSAAGIWKMEKTTWVPISIGIAALINIALNVWLVPEFGGIGAAIATSISFLIWNVITLLISEKLWPVGYPFGIFGLQIGIGAAACMGILFLYEQDQQLWKVLVVAAIASVILIGLAVKPAHLVGLHSYLEARIS